MEILIRLKLHMQPSAHHDNILVLLACLMKLRVFYIEDTLNKTSVGHECAVHFV